MSDFRRTSTSAFVDDVTSRDVGPNDVFVIPERLDNLPRWWHYVLDETGAWPTLVLHISNSSRRHLFLFAALRLLVRCSSNAVHSRTAYYQAQGGQNRKRWVPTYLSHKLLCVHP
jgi:hypothetical protein